MIGLKSGFEELKRMVGKGDSDEDWYYNRHGKFPVINELVDEMKTKLQNGANHALGFLSTPYDPSDTDNELPYLPNGVEKALRVSGINTPQAKVATKLLKKKVPIISDVNTVLGAYDVYKNYYKPIADYINGGRTEKNRFKRAERKRDDRVLAWQRAFNEQYLKNNKDPELAKELKDYRDEIVKEESNKAIQPNYKRQFDLTKHAANLVTNKLLIPKIRKWGNSERRDRVVPFIIQGKSQKLSAEEIQEVFKTKGKKKEKKRKDDEDDEKDDKEDSVDRLMKQLQKQMRKD